MAAFDLDPTKEDILTFGARTYRRLQVLSHTSTASTSSSRKSGHTSLDILADMDDAQMEAFDDELFGEISAEILRHGLGSVDPTSVTIEVSGVEYRFAMVSQSIPFVAQNNVLASTTHGKVRYLPLPLPNAISSSSSPDFSCCKLTANASNLGSTRFAHPLLLSSLQYANYSYIDKLRRPFIPP